MEEIGWALQGQTRSFDLPLGARLIAGRAPDAIVPLPLTDPHASRYHAAFEASFHGVRVVDLDSRNGVFVNDKRVKEIVAKEGDLVRLGSSVFRLACVFEPRASLPAAVVTDSKRPTASTRALSFTCDVCGARVNRRVRDPETWWTEVAWICDGCTAERRTDRETWQWPAPARIGELELLRFLARGGMTAVYEARHVRAGVRAAVKVMLPDRTLDGVAKKRFTQEQQIASQLAHASIVRCFDVGQTDAGDLYVATEFMSHGDVDALASPQSNVKAVVALVTEMFDALAYAHGLGIVHRDIKPANLLLAPADNTGRAHAKLADFGLAKSFREIGGHIAREDDLLGSVGFAAPEQLLGFTDAGPSADVYAGGASLYYLLTGELPVVLPCPASQASDTQICLATLADERVPLAKRRRVHPFLCEQIDLLCARDPQKRAHLSAAEVAATLRAIPA